MRGKLGDRQLAILKVLGEHRYWYPGCGWIWGSLGETQRVLRTLVARGLVLQLPDRYTVSEGGQAFLRERFPVKPVPAIAPEPEKPLAWHKGTHMWDSHDGYPRHQHSVNGALTIAPDDNSVHFEGGKPFGKPKPDEYPPRGSATPSPAVQLRAALKDALEGLNEMLPYVPAHFREKHDLELYVTRAETALGEIK